MSRFFTPSITVVYIQTMFSFCLGMPVASMGMPGSMMVNKPRTGSFGPPAPGHAPAPQPAGFVLFTLYLLMSVVL